MLKLGIVGISGRMGHAVYDSCVGMEGIKVVCGICEKNTTLPVGFNAETAETPEALTELPDIFIDFSRPEISTKVVEFAKEHKIRMVIGTTGFDYSQKEKIKDASRSISIVMAANFSVAINVLLTLIKKTASIMQDSDIEIVEAHHRYKVDAPSGTALAMGEAAAEGRNVNLKDVMVAGRNGITGERKYGTIGFSSIRGGDIVGEHEAMFCNDGERLTIGHVATSRHTFSNGAVRAALWVADKGNGLFSMTDVLGLNKF
ncbi:MAG: 4-hydroxy-tetrahydrodipicolinate reductase [Succinivibrio sp.]|nr:4-hydroxy-tetrahydrodipicolinate reductase [Succinivibrio sp.]